MNRLLTDEQIAVGDESLENGRLSPTMIMDLVSIFRGYLSELADKYPLEATFTAENDNDGLGRQRCAKLAACLAVFNENQFTPQSGYAPTNANRTGFNYSMDGEVFEVFKYAFCLFWALPRQFQNNFQNGSRSQTSAQGRFVNRF